MALFPAFAADLVREVTSTTTDGDIMLDAGPDIGFITWESAFGDGGRAPYVINDFVGNWETGIGTVHAGTPFYITRDSIWWSSNAGAQVDFTGISARVYCAPNAGGAGLSTQSTFRGTSFPTNNLDVSYGGDFASFYFGIGTGAGNMWYCLDATDGAAEWWGLLANHLSNTKNSGTNNVLAGLNNSAYGASSAVLFGDNNQTNATSAAAAKGRYANASVPGSENFGAAEPTSPSFAQHQVISLPLALRTTNATTTAMVLNGSTSYSMTPPNSSAWWVTLDVVAWDTANNLSSAWQIKALVKRNGSAAPTIVGSSSATALYQDASASSWTLAVAISGNNVVFNCTGQASHTISWTGNARIVQAL